MDVGVLEVGMLGRWDATNVANAQTSRSSPTSASTTRSSPADGRRHRAREGGHHQAGLSVFRDRDTDPPADRFSPPSRTPRCCCATRISRRSTPRSRSAAAWWTCARRRRSDDVFVPSTEPTRGERRGRNRRCRDVSSTSRCQRRRSSEGFASVDDAWPVRGGRTAAARGDRRCAQPGGADTCAQVFFDDFRPRRSTCPGDRYAEESRSAELLGALRADEFDLVVIAYGTESARCSTRPRWRDCGSRSRVRGGARVPMVSRRPAHTRSGIFDADDAVLVAAGSIYVAGRPRRPYP